MVSLNPSSADNAHISVRELHKIYKRGSESIDVLRGLNLNIQAGEFLAFMGPSGSGKTTLLNLIGGIDVPNSGTITVDGQRIDNLSSSALTRWRSRHVGERG